MNATIAAQMSGADFLKLRKKRGTVAFALLFACVPLVIAFVVTGVQHSSNPARYQPGGGMHGFRDGLMLLALFMGPLAAILIGSEAGAGDVSSGVFRDLVVTGRSRRALFAARVPAALALCWTVMALAYVILIAGTLLLASSAPTPSASLMLEGVGFVAVATGVVCVVTVGLASLLSSKPGAITAAIGWQLVASPLIANIDSLGSVRELVLSQPLAHFSPVHLEGTHVSMSGGTAVLVAAVWLAIFVGLGAWKTNSMDA